MDEDLYVTVPGCLGVPLKQGGATDKCLVENGWKNKNQRITKADQHLMMPLNRRGQKEVLKYLKMIEEGHASGIVNEFLFGGLKDQTFHYSMEFDIRQERDLYAPNYQIEEESPRFRFIELFAGIGGFRLGLQPLGGACVFSCELDRHARVLYREYFGDLPEKDVTALKAQDIPEYDLLTAGFPCQSFSTIGNRLGFEDERTGGCFFELVRILRSTKPKSFLFENVKGLVIVNDGKYLETVLEELEKSGYTVHWQVHDTNCIVPQHRERVFFVGFRNDLDVNFSWPEFKGKFDLKSIWLNEEEISEICGPWELMLTKEKFAKVVDPEDKVVTEDHQIPLRTITSSYRHSWKHSQFIQQPFLERPRFFAPREVARLMGFPENFPVTNERIYRVLGNAVIPPIIEIIGCSVIDALEQSNVL